MNTNQDKKSQVISAAELASVSNISNLTNDRIQALTGGHGMLNIAVHTVANVITEEVLKNGKMSIDNADVRRLPVEDIMEKAIKTAKDSGADGANAALITALLMYLAGSKAQVGIPAGNRKLGATARMIAGVDRCGVAAIPSPKMNSKVSGFPAVMAIYQAALDGKLTSIDGNKVPENASGGPMFGHSTLGEDIVWPELSENGARIGTQAMIDAMAGVGIHPNGFIAAIMGSAAILEIIHPDAEVPESEGSYGRTTSVYLVGKTAAKTAGLPEKLHVRVTGEEFETAKVVGDVGLILKDIGGPSVIGMMALEEIFAVFEEGISGFSTGPVNAPIGHVAGYAVVGMKALIDNNGDEDKVAKLIVKDRTAGSFSPNVALICINLISRKSAELRNGPVTRMLIKATDPTTAKEIHLRAEYSYDELTSGKTLEEVVTALEDDRVAYIEEHAGKIFSGMLDADVKVKITEIANGARRTNKIAKKYLAFDPILSVNITVNGITTEFKDFPNTLVPAISRGEREDLEDLAPLAAAVLSEVALASGSTLNVVVPAGVASALKLHTPEDAAAICEKTATLSAGIPGGKASATNIGNMALEIMEA